jgi:hemerythrin superfamily protein
MRRPFDGTPSMRTGSPARKGAAGISEAWLLLHRSAPMTTITETLRHDHERLEELFAELANAVDGADPATIQRVWSQFEQALMAHLEAEERHLMPAVEKRHPDDVRRTRGEHESIRRLVQELGVRADIHTLRKEVADQLITTLREHAKREEKTIYLWGDESGGAALLHAIIAVLKGQRPISLESRRPD